MEQDLHANIIIVTDTYAQVNGVSTTYKNIEIVAQQRNLNLSILHPGCFRWVSMPFYPEIQLAIQPIKLWKTLNQLNPDYMHVATEGPMGFIARLWCIYRKKPFTTSYHTKFPEYLKVILGIPEKFTYAYLRWFHRAAKVTFVTTPSMQSELEAHGFKHLVVWSRGVNQALLSRLPMGIAGSRLNVLNVGRVSKEKNLDVLCALEDRFNITIVGDGPYLETLKSKYRHVKFLGYKFGAELANLYAQHDVFAFPSRTDTFGIVIIEALCNGLPVAAYPVAGPKDIIQHGKNGILSHDLEMAINSCKGLDRQSIQSEARARWSWKHCVDIFLTNLQH